MSTIADPRRALMTPDRRMNWLMLYLFDRSPGSNMVDYTVDVLDRAFVDAYTLSTNAPHNVMNYGANRCAMLGRDLAELHKQERLYRHRVGVSGMGPGFPRWVWSYRLTQAGRDHAVMLDRIRARNAA